MIVLGLSGQAGSGKDTVADYLIKRYGYVKFSFSDALYREVVQAFGLEDESLLRDRATKELESPLLAGENCDDAGFLAVLKEHVYSGGEPLSPRFVLQLWGTEYRRAQDPNYWIKKADEWIYDLWSMFPYGELRPQKFVNTSVRFPNEQAWTHEFTNGNVWHLHRDAVAPVHAHESETPLPVLQGEREIWNNSDLEHLHIGVDQLMRTNAQFVRMEPMLPDQEAT